MIFQKTSFKSPILIVVGILIVIVLISTTGNFCGLQHMTIMTDIKSYEKLLDPESCEVIVEKIDFFNDECEPQIEILDCS
ncbi:MAG: hypothetical protein COA77_10035 [Thaumarchaeota archaeon]|nr:MAG: hypothetical protein COA77_10035 [Nitrososphaerota archaeon]